MRIEDRVQLYKAIFHDCKALEPVREIVEAGLFTDKLEALEQIRELNTALADAYKVSIPVITVWVRDDSYIPETGEIFLTEPDLRGFLHQFRHHLQNVERKYERRGLTAEDRLELSQIPYKDTIYRMRGEDDAIAWSKFILDSVVTERAI